MNRFKILLVIIAFLVASCEEMDSLFKDKDTGLSEEEVVKGLKTALEVGSDTAVAVTSEVNGYYKDEAIKIMLPPEADIIYEHKDDASFQFLGLDQLIDDVVLSINRSAEDAASEASPILKDAIVSLSIADGWNILNGKNPADTSNQEAAFDSTAATGYLIATTYDELFDTFRPKINNSLKREWVGGVSTKQLWDDLTSTYNATAEPLGMETVDTELDVFVTEKALDGLFLKVANEEKEIRKDPAQWSGTLVEDILKKVFSS
ncbi:MAG: DUF4197 domain-containing protein [Bacteroidales bacterium]|nr:DUF4197 domain-containing protein [Bacteroidales bacterium]